MYICDKVQVKMYIHGSPRIAYYQTKTPQEHVYKYFDIL